MLAPHALPAVAPRSDIRSSYGKDSRLELRRRRRGGLSSSMNSLATLSGCECSEWDDQLSHANGNQITSAVPTDERLHVDAEWLK
jgi:hypothetical protein